MKVPTCFKNPDKPTFIDLILTNRPNLFQHSSAFDSSLSDFHLLTANKFKMGRQKLKPKIIVYRDYKNFDNAKFRSDIFNIFNRHAPIKKIYSIYLIAMSL